MISIIVHSTITTKNKPIVRSDFVYTWFDIGCHIGESYGFWFLRLFEDISFTCSGLPKNHDQHAVKIVQLPQHVLSFIFVADVWLTHFVPWMHKKNVRWCNDATNGSIQIRLPSRPRFSSLTWKPSLFARAPTAVGALCSVNVMPMRPSPLFSVKRIRESSGKMGSATVSFQRPWWVD